MKKMLAGLASLALLLGGLSAASPAAAAEQAPAGVLKGMPVVDSSGKPVGQLTNRSGGKMQSRATLAGPYFEYAQVAQILGNGTNTDGATGLAALASTHNPYRYSNTHSLWEMAARSATGTNYTELGWTKDAGVCGQSTHPCLFTGSWVNGSFQGYNSTNPNWEDNPGESVNAGTALAYTAVGAAPSIFNQWRIERTTGEAWAPNPTADGWRFAWKAGGVDHIVGMIEDSQWTAAGVSDYKEIGVAQFFWETADVLDPNTCIDMGSGVYGTSANPSAAAQLKAYSIAGAPIDPTSGVTEDNVPDNVAVQPSGSSPNAWRIHQKPADLDYVLGGGTGFVGGTTNYTGTTAGANGSC